MTALEKTALEKAVLEREFFRSPRGPAPSDEDMWRLVFDPRASDLIVRHEWQAAGHAGLDEYTVPEFLAEKSAAAEALVTLLFGRVPVAV